LLLRLFLAAFLFGALLTLLAARLYPLPDMPRLPSDATALANVGREEMFYIRLPDDRVGSPRAASVAPFPKQAFAREGADRILAELFKLRNSEGRVIGLASKMSGPVAFPNQRRRDNTDWILLIPSRGALLMSTEGRPADQERNYPSNYLGLDPTRAGVIVAGTNEFKGLAGFFIEETEVERVDENGQSFGTLSLRTRVQGASQ
jgi:hypothetical protein